MNGLYCVEGGTWKQGKSRWVVGQSHISNATKGMGILAVKGVRSEYMHLTIGFVATCLWKMVQNIGFPN